ncbi:DNA-binding protein RDGA [Shewanella sairae]|uniref:DNA-binding protein RDGA n=1 Tax=Shewanella sairae TaxID=190310 RepID=A0ABQ4PLE9_9GAMM|nr:S24 family peptidase [Shewanella sairae]MCL1131902.1 helix-turn-helix domain-containing protein [Shewanella sairae]GIU48894.1 DNA-binding protein RDGA [Shewanella sairae]
MSENHIAANVKWLRVNAGLSQEELAEKINVTKSTISQWERGLFQPKHRHINALAQYFNVSTNSLIVGDAEGFNAREQANLNSECDCYDELKKIRYLSSTYVAAGIGCSNSEDYEHELIHIKELPYKKNYNELLCLNVSGDSMEPVLQNGSLLVIDTANKEIVDGSMYVFVQEDVLRVKLFSYEKNMLKVESYNERYKDEYYENDEQFSIHIVGKVVFYATKLE